MKLSFFRKPHLATFFASLILCISCTTESSFTDKDGGITSHYQKSTKDLTEEEIRTFFAEYKKHFDKVQPSYNKVIEKVKSGLSREDLINDPDMAKVMSEMKQPSIELFTNLQFSDEEYVEMFGTSKIDEISDYLTGGGIFLYTLQPEYQETAYNPPLAVACFLEATGIGAGMALLGGLTGALGGAAIRAAFIRVVTKVGIRTLSGIGLGLMAAEFTWCMLRGD